MLSPYGRLFKAWKWPLPARITSDPPKTQSPSVERLIRDCRTSALYSQEGLTETRTRMTRRHQARLRSHQLPLPRHQGRGPSAPSPAAPARAGLPVTTTTPWWLLGHAHIAQPRRRLAAAGIDVGGMAAVDLIVRVQAQCCVVVHLAANIKTREQVGRDQRFGTEPSRVPRQSPTAHQSLSEVVALREDLGKLRMDCVIVVHQQCPLQCLYRTSHVLLSTAITRHSDPSCRAWRCTGLNSLKP